MDWLVVHTPEILAGIVVLLIGCGVLVYFRGYSKKHWKAGVSVRQSVISFKTLWELVCRYLLCSCIAVFHSVSGSVPAILQDPSPRIGVDNLDAGLFTVNVEARATAHGFEDAR